MDSRTSIKNKTIKSNLVALTLAAAAMLLVVMLMFTQIGNAAGSADNSGDKSDEDKPDISIEVVEDIPATDIEEERVPLADSAHTAAAGSARFMAAAWIAAVLVIAYIIFILSGMRLRKARRLKRAGAEGDRSSGDNTGRKL